MPNKKDDWWMRRDKAVCDVNLEKKKFSFWDSKWFDFLMWYLCACGIGFNVLMVLLIGFGVAVFFRIGG
jgi:hypothetical protein